MVKAQEEQKRRSSISTLRVIGLCLLSAGIAELIFTGFTFSQRLLYSAGRISILFLTFYIVHRFAQATLSYYRPKLRDLFIFHSVLIGAICITGLGRFFALALTEYSRSQPFFVSLHAESLHFAIPFAAGGMMLQAVLGLHFGLVFALCLSLTLGLYTPVNVSSVFVPYVFVTNLVACLSMARFRSRSAYLKAGLNVAIISLPFALASFVTGTNVDINDLAVRVAGAFLSGALCTFIVAGITPAFEYLGGYVTDMRLIEIATLDNPLLKDLSLRAPGTWNHSMVLGMVGEAAASEIGANALLVRVGAYFHDIGKIKKPAYFVENQMVGENRHEKLSTSMSALIIRSHVKDGIELAHKHKIPQAIIDMIPQHHGTSLIEYFYSKACKEAEEAGEGTEVDKNLFTYPGPKPQTREAGILMLADKIESATRTLAEPTVDRIQGLVQKMINKIFASGELDECDLTLRDLHAIAACFTRVLSSIYHQRIAYAEPAEKTAEVRAEAKEVGGESSPAPLESAEKNGQKTSAGEAAARPKGAEDLKRLGM